MLRGIKWLQNYERRIIELARSRPKLVRLRQAGFSRRGSDNFRFPIYALEVGLPKALKKKPAGLVAGVHGLERIGVDVALDFLEYSLDKKEDGLYPLLARGKFAIACIPILNPGGLALARRSNPSGVDLMRNSGIDGEKAVPFFGGHRLSPHLPYYRGRVMEPETRVLNRFLETYFFSAKNTVLPVIDIHSGFGFHSSVWWPYAGRPTPCPDHELYRKLAFQMQSFGHRDYHFCQTSESYGLHGDLWDRIYDSYRAHRIERAADWRSRFLPLTLEIGTWSGLQKEPLRLLRKNKIFNPKKKDRKTAARRHRGLLRDLTAVAMTKLDDWT